MKPFLFPKEVRILKRSDFLRRSKTDRKIAFPHFVVIIKSNHLGRTRLGLTVGKKAGGAVRRNRIKRLLREFFRQSHNKFPSSRDIIIIALKGSDPLTYRQVCEELTPLLVWWDFWPGAFRDFFYSGYGCIKKSYLPFSHLPAGSTPPVLNILSRLFKHMG